ncbi:FAD-dependent oxidoreductase [Streptomyces lavendulae]|uniref:FAD-dependent oxidoreductase n=1 Tax=Streptomyces lavendulae TaxID=1914 RepID=UPI0024A500EC|nr:FAD-dependent oxidoreductase [Streptomyces lavendulae]GLX19546.1 FAD-dependent oxidoreductase [Streptomyces lavendulae subsp. lavendulae]GLX27041.1 FAD-dependent oxidoreductase [Streptomyces lavendulae subsp. lavendulae]
MHDVVIVGAGPVGLALACELGLAGCSVVVLEREPGLGSPLRSAPLGRRGLSAASVEAFYRRGLLEPLLAASGVQEVFRAADGAGAPTGPRLVGHFAGMMIDGDRVDVTALPFRLPGPAPEAVMTDLEAVETVLSARASKLGVEIRRGVPVSAVTQNAESVVARAGADAYEARWLVGCDGGRSTVRRLADFEFVGTEPQFTGYTLQATLADPESVRPGFHLTPTGMYLRMPAGGHIAMMDFDGGAFDRSRPLTRDHLQAVLRRVSGIDVTIDEVRLASSFTDRAMQTTSYRRGRVLLAGDAAHIHSPLGGQGLNTGLGDAVNLGWKLAATVHGHAPDGLLDTYDDERHPIGAAVLDWSRAQVATMRPEPHAQAIQAVVRELVGTRDGATYVFGRLSGSWIRYDLGSGHPLVGRSAPDFRFEDGTRLGDLMEDGRGVLLDLTTDRRLRASVTGREGRIRYAAGRAENDLGSGAVLVRPDGVVAWAGERHPDREGCEQAVRRWFGAPAPAGLTGGARPGGETRRPGPSFG